MINSFSYWNPRSQSEAGVCMCVGPDMCRYGGNGCTLYLLTQHWFGWSRGFQPRSANKPTKKRTFVRQHATGGVGHGGCWVALTQSGRVVVAGPAGVQCRRRRRKGRSVGSVVGVAGGRPTPSLWRWWKGGSGWGHDCGAERVQYDPHGRRGPWRVCVCASQRPASHLKQVGGKVQCNTPRRRRRVS